MTPAPRRRNAGKLLARLNPRSMSLNFGGPRGSGAPELTALDIAGALGAAGSRGPGHRLAVDVLCLRWWPSRVEGPAVVVGHKEVRRPIKAEPGFRIERMPIERRTETPAFLAIAGVVARSLGHRARRIEGATGKKVGQRAFQERWARAVIEEYRSPRICENCASTGRPGECPVPAYQGDRIIRFDWVLCEACDGSGVLGWAKYRRANRVGIREATFREELNGIHEGALALLRELEHRGAVMFVRRLG